jgi:hypothetical protein
MTFCLLSGAALVLASGAMALGLADGGVRRAVHLALARRLRGPFSPRLVVVGDSLAAGCPWSRLDRRPFAVLNLAEGGATIRQIAGQVYAARDFPDATLLIDGGLNDLLFDGSTLDRFEADYGALFRRAAQARVIVTLMPFTANPADAAMITAANAILARLGAERGHAVIDLNDVVSQDGVRRPQMTNDGLHFSRDANAAWIEAARRVLRGP